MRTIGPVPAKGARATRLGDTGPDAPPGAHRVWQVRSKRRGAAAAGLGPVRPGSGLRLTIRLLAGLALAAVAAQGAVSAAADRVAAAALTQSLGGEARVTVTALPFWQLARGRFQHLTVTAQNLRTGTLDIRALRADWRDGSVRMAALRAGRPMADWLGGGRLTVHLTLTPRALLDALPPTGALRITRLGLRPPGAWVDGRVALGELHLEFRALGTLRVIDGGDVLVFRVTTLHAGPLVLRSSLGIPVVDLRQTPLRSLLWVTGAHVTATGIDVELTNRPHA